MEAWPGADEDRAPDPLVGPRCRANPAWHALPQDHRTARRAAIIRPDVRQYRCACGGVPQYLSVSARRRQQPRVGDSGHSPGAHALRDLCIYLTSMRNLRMLAA